MWENTVRGTLKNLNIYVVPYKGQEERGITEDIPDGPCIGIILEREAKARKWRPAKTELNAVQRLNQIPWLKQVYGERHTLIWSHRDGKPFRVKDLVTQTVTYHSHDRAFELSDKTLIKPDGEYLSVEP